MSWLGALSIAFLLSFIVLLLIFVDSEVRRIPVRQAEAESRSLELLLSRLSEEQKSQYERLGYFEAIGSHTGSRYRICRGTSRNVWVLKGSGQVGRCFFPAGLSTSGDCMLAQKIAIECCEDEVLRIALPF